MFVRNCWYVAGWRRDLVRGALLPMTVIGEPIVLFRTEAGLPIALQDRCCHRSARLSKGRLEGDCVRCMYHGLMFDHRGRCVEIPGQDKIPPAAYVKSFPVEESGCWVWVWMGDPKRADRALIPASHALDDPMWDLRTGQVDYAADYQLINDNLTDFSHLSFVHPNSFGASSSFAAVRPSVEPIERGVRISRWMTGGAKENRNVASAVGRNADVPVTYMTYDYVVPGILIMRSESFRIEDYPADGRSAPTGTPVTANTNMQAVTPMTVDSSRYFFVTGPRAGPDSAPKAEKLLQIMNIAFEEDREMIESQARNIKLKSGPEIATTADRAAIMFRAIIRKMAKAESEADAKSAQALVDTE